MARLLIVDDDVAQLAILELLLQESGHEIHVAATLAEALRLLVEIEPDVLVMDLRIPRVQDGLTLIRQGEAQPRRTRIVVLSGWPADLQDRPEEKQVDRVFTKPVRPALLLRAIAELSVWLLLLLAGAAPVPAETFRFSLAKPAEVLAHLEMSSPGADWARPGHEAALADLALDGVVRQQVMLWDGERRRRYPVFLGRLGAGEHAMNIERNAKYSAAGPALKVWSARTQELDRGDPEWDAVAHAPVLFARADTLGGFSDVPLIVYCERIQERGRTCLQYTVIFSNEDGGTSTRALMARWGRTTDIEYVYKAWLDAGGTVKRATIQAKDHKEVEFRGRRDGAHPLLIPSTRNNMVSGQGSSAIRYQIAPVTVSLAQHSREQVMDDDPATYRVMAKELEREGKTRPFGIVDGEKVSDPRNYLYIEARASQRDSAIVALVRLRGERLWHSSALGRADYAISRDGWFRTTVELPPGTKPGQIGEIAFECLVKPGKPAPPAGLCRLEAVSKVFLLGPDYIPGETLWAHSDPVDIPSGQMITFSRYSRRATRSAAPSSGRSASLAAPGSSRPRRPPLQAPESPPRT